MITGIIPPPFRFCSHMLINQRNLSQFGFEFGIAPFEVVFHPLRMQRLLRENSVYRRFCGAGQAMQSALLKTERLASAAEAPRSCTVYGTTKVAALPVSG